MTYIIIRRDPLIPLDRDSAIMERAPIREDTKEFVARMWDIESQVAERLALVAQHDALSMDEKSRTMSGIKVGGRVWLSAHGITMPWDRHRPSKKLNARYYGPFLVLEHTSPVTFRLKLPEAVNIHPIFHVGLLKPYVGKEPDSKPLPTPDKSGEYEIEKILGHRKRRDGKYRYLVKWRGYSYEESTWEPSSNFKSKTLKAYHRERKERKANESGSSSDDEPTGKAHAAAIGGGVKLGR